MPTSSHVRVVRITYPQPGLWILSILVDCLRSSAGAWISPWFPTGRLPAVERIDRRDLTVSAKPTR